MRVLSPDIDFIFFVSFCTESLPLFTAGVTARVEVKASPLLAKTTPVVEFEGIGVVVVEVVALIQSWSIKVR